MKTQQNKQKKPRIFLALILAFAMLSGQFPATYATQNTAGVTDETPETGGPQNSTEEETSENGTGTGQSSDPGGEEIGPGEVKGPDEPDKDPETDEADTEVESGEDENVTADGDSSGQDPATGSVTNTAASGFGLFAPLADGPYVYTVDLYGQNDDQPRLPADVLSLDLLNAAGEIVGDISNVSLSTGNDRYQRIRFSSELNHVTVRINEYDTTNNNNWSAFSDGNNKLVALTPQHNHAYLHEHMQATYYVSADPSSRDTTVTIVKGTTDPNTFSFNFWNGSENIFAANIGTADSLSLIPAGTTADDRVQISHNLGAIAADDIWFKLRLKPGSGWNDEATAFGESFSDENWSGGNLGHYVMPTQTPVPPRFLPLQHKLLPL